MNNNLSSFHTTYKKTIFHNFTKDIEEKNKIIWFQSTFLQVENSTFLKNDFFEYFPNLVILIFRQNFILNINQMLNRKMLKLLHILDLSKNSIEKLNFLKNFTTNTLIEIDLSKTKIKIILKEDINFLNNLKILKIRYCNLKRIEINHLRKLKEIYLEKSEYFHSDLIHIKNDLNYLNKFFSDNFAFCCILKKNYKKNFVCKPSVSLIKSCEKMIKNIPLAIFFWLIGIIGFLDNIATIYLTFAYINTSKIFRIVLSTADLLMSIYVTSISIVNSEFDDSYIENDLKWRKSIYCRILGGIFNCSIFISYLFANLITLERYFTLKYPFKENIFKSHQIKLSVVGILAVFLFIILPQNFLLVCFKI